MKMNHPPAQQMVAADVEARRPLYWSRSLRLQPLIEIGSIVSSRHKLGLRNKYIKNQFFADKSYFTKQHAQLFLLRIVPHVNQVQKEPDWEYKAKIIKIVCIPEKSGLVHPTALCVFVHPCKRLSGKISG